MIGAMKNREATKAAKFKNRDSKIFNDGRYELHGSDMAEMRERVMARYGWRCAVRGCKTPHEWLQLDHIKPRSKGRDDGFENLQPLCVHCHHAKHVRVKFQKVPA